MKRSSFSLPKVQNCSCASPMERRAVSVSLGVVAAVQRPLRLATVEVLKRLQKPDSANIPAVIRITYKAKGQSSSIRRWIGPQTTTNDEEVDTHSVVTSIETSVETSAFPQQRRKFVENSRKFSKILMCIVSALEMFQDTPGSLEVLFSLVQNKAFRPRQRFYEILRYYRAFSA